MDYFFNFDKIAYVKGDRPEGCILCLIDAGSEQVVNLTVYQSTYFNVSLNLYPYNPGHLMIFPRRHINDIRSMTPQEEIELLKVQRGMLEVIDRTHFPSGYNIGYNMGRVAGASIEHLHLHVIPRYQHEIGIADLIAGKRVLIESPLETARRVRESIRSHRPSILST